MYRDILQRLYGWNIVKMGMVVLHPDHAEAQEFWHEPCPQSALLLEMQRERRKLAAGK